LFTGKTPLVIDSTDLIKNPQKFLEVICNKLEINFSEQMLSWEPQFRTRKKKLKSPFPWLWTGELPPTVWYSNINQSTGFRPYQEKETHFPDELMPVLDECLPFYGKLYQYRLTID
jgi:hypothetical protein